MKKFVKKILPAFLLALTLCAGLTALAACGDKDNDVVFEGENPNIFGNVPAVVTLTLKPDGKANVVVFFDTELEFVKNMEENLKKSGTYKFENDKYTVTLGEGEGQKVYESTFDSATGKYKITYMIATEQGERPVEIYYTKA